MANELLLDIGRTASEIGRAFAPVAASLCGGGVVWKLVDKLIDVAEARRKSREEHEGETNKELRHKLSEANDKLVDCIKDAAQVPFLQVALAECQKQRDENEERAEKAEKELALAELRHRHEIYQKDGDMRQKNAVHKVLWEFFELMNDEEGQKFLKAARERKGKL